MDAMAGNIIVNTSNGLKHEFWAERSEDQNLVHLFVMLRLF